MKIDQLLIGLLMFSLFVASGALIFSNVNNNYEIDANTTIFNGTDNPNSNGSLYNTLDDMESITSQAKNKILSNNSVSKTDALDNFFAGSYATIQLTGNSFKLISQIINNISITLGVPPFITSFFFIIIILAIIFSIIYLLFRFRG